MARKTTKTGSKASKRTARTTKSARKAPVRKTAARTDPYERSFDVDVDVGDLPNPAS